MSAELGEEKWEGTVSAKLTCCSVEQVWPLLEDFFNIHKWTPTIDTCYGIEGTSGQPGCIRYCSKTSVSTDGTGDIVTRWAHEKLIAIDLVEGCFSYKITENNTGFHSHLATMKLLPDGNGCEMIYSFVLEPVKGCSVEDLVALYDTAIHTMARRMEDGIRSEK